MTDILGNITAGETAGDVVWLNLVIFCPFYFTRCRFGARRIYTHSKFCFTRNAYRYRVNLIIARTVD